MCVDYFGDPGYKDVPNLADVGYRAVRIGEAQISYGGPGAAGRARLAGQIVLDRLGTV